MNKLTPMHHPRLPIPLVALLTTVAALFAPGASAETSPYTIGASETVTRDSNIARLRDDVPTPASVQSVADWVATTTLFGGIDQPIGRQRVFGNLSLRDNRYRYNKDYNNLAYGLSTGLDWETVDRISGNLFLIANRNLASFDRSTTNSPIIVKNVEQTRQYGVRARIGVVTDVTFEGGLSRQTQKYSVVGDRLAQTVFSLGTRYRTGGELSFGAGLRLTNGDYPDNNDSFKGRNIDLTSTWAPSTVSNVDARVSFGKTDHTNDAANDFSGVTGSLAWKWVPTGRLVLNTQVSRETGNDSSFSTANTQTGPAGGQSERSRLTSTLALNATYEASAKILLTAGVTRQSRDLARTSPAQTDGDRLTRVQLGARWVPTRTLEFACNVGRDSRTAETKLLTYGYGATTYACSGQIAVNP